MNSFNFKNELKFILLCAAALDLIVYGISVFFIGISISAAVGLILGNIIMIFNLWHLYKSIIKLTSLGGGDKNPMMGGYLLRSLAVCAGILISFKFDWINTVCTVLPLFYPKLIYTLHSIIKGGK